MLARTGVATLALAVCFALNACQTLPYQGQAREVTRKPKKGGSIAIPTGGRPEDRTRAEEVMRGNCAPDPFAIMEEGEVVTGQEVVANSRETDRRSTEHQAGSFFGVPVMMGDQGGRDSQTTSVTKSIKEWRISYECARPVKSAKPSDARPIRVQ
jgi:hypothetical protein